MSLYEEDSCTVYDFLCFSETGGDTSSQLSLANESQYLLLSVPSIDVLRDKIRERCEAGESSELIGQ